MGQSTNLLDCTSLQLLVSSLYRLPNHLNYINMCWLEHSSTKYGCGMRRPGVSLKTYTCAQYRQWVGRKEAYESVHGPSTFSEAKRHKVCTYQGSYTTTRPCRAFPQMASNCIVRRYRDFRDELNERKILKLYFYLHAIRAWTIDRGWCWQQDSEP